MDFCAVFGVSYYQQHTIPSIPNCYFCFPECYVSSGEVNINGLSVNGLETFMWDSLAPASLTFDLSVLNLVLCGQLL